MINRQLSGTILALLLCCACIGTRAQAPVNEPDLNKPKLFANLPNEIPIDITELKQLLSGSTETGKEVSLKSLDKRSSFSGKIISAASKYENNMHSVVIRSTNFNGATLTLSSSTQPDGTVTFKGRIISFQHADLFELEKRNNEYVLVKKNFYELINE